MFCKSCEGLGREEEKCNHTKDPRNPSNASSKLQQKNQSSAEVEDGEWIPVNDRAKRDPPKLVKSGQVWENKKSMSIQLGNKNDYNVLFGMKSFLLTQDQSLPSNLPFKPYQTISVVFSPYPKQTLLLQPKTKHLEKTISSHGVDKFLCLDGPQ